MSDPTTRGDIRVDRIALDDSSGVAALVTIDRPDQLNAIDWDLLQSLDSVLDEADADPTVRALLITGAGRAFSAGGDLKKYVELQRDPVGFPAFVADLHATFGRLRTSRYPTIALVNGITAAGGLELMLNCDISIVAASARIGDAHLNFGQMGGGGSLTLLPRAIGRQRAAELVLTGRFMDADEAVAVGLALRSVPDDALLDEGVGLAQRIASKSPLAVANAKHVMHATWSETLSVSSALQLELERNAYYCLTSSDAREGLDAFSDKRSPRFTGR